MTSPGSTDMSPHWSAAEKVQYLLTLPWTVAIEVTPDGERIARIHEIPQASARGRNDTRVAQQLWKSLAVAVEEMVRANHEIPAPEGVKLPWLLDDAVPTGRRMPGERSAAGITPRGAAKNRPAPTVSRVVRLWSNEDEWRNR